MGKSIVLLLIVVSLSGCAGMFEPTPDVDKVSHGFGESMRWKDFPAAAKYVHNDNRKEFIGQFTSDDDLHIVDSQIIYLNMDKKGEASAQYLMEYYRLPSGSIKKWQWDQEWQLVEEKGQADVWLIMNKPPALPWKR